MRLFYLFILIFSVLYNLSEGRPNIIILLADDLGWNDLSFHGSPQIPTPNLDSLAKDGIVLNNYYVCPVCSPSRAALMTGQYPIHIGMQHSVIFIGEPWGVPLNVTLLPEHLRKLGYETHAVGKWHLGYFRKEYTPTFRGFNSHYGFWGGKEDYFDHTNFEDNLDHQTEKLWGLDFRHNMESVTNETGKYSTELFEHQAEKIILNHDNTKPLFLYVSYQAVHSANSYTPLQAPQKYINRFLYIKDHNRRIYAGMVSALDDSVKTIVDALKLKNMLQNSIILFSTDNGGAPAGLNYNAASNWPLRGAKGTLWEGGVRGISFIWSPLLNRPCCTSMDLMHITDWLPTLYHAAGGNVSALGKHDGYNMWNTLSENEPSPRSEVLLNIDPVWNVSALRVGNYKLIQGAVYDGKWNGWYGPPGRKNHSCVTEPSKQLLFNSELLCGEKPANAIACFPEKSPCLFDVDKDPCEYDNLATKEPEKLKELLVRLSFYEKSAVPPGNKPADPRSNPKFHNFQWTNWMDYV